MYGLSQSNTYAEWVMTYVMELKPGMLSCLYVISLIFVWNNSFQGLSLRFRPLGLLYFSELR